MIRLFTFLLVIVGLSATSMQASAKPPTPTITAQFDKTEYQEGDTATLTLNSNLTAKHTWTLTDPGTSWSKVSETETGAVYTGVVNTASTVSVVLRRTWDNVTASQSFDYTVASTTTEEPPTTDQKIIGMSAPANLWDQRIAEVGPGVKARRIFANLTSTGDSQWSLVQDAVADGMMPVISYKVPNVTTAGSGGYNAWADTAAARLAALNVPVVVAIWHEPNGDMTPAQFVAMQNQLVPHFKDKGQIKVGPILNGWLLDNRVADFASFTTPALLALWDFVAVDSYQSGSISSPGTKMPARAIPLLANWLDEQGFPDKPIGLGEYNGFTAAAIAEAGETLLSTPEVWFGLAWNSTGGSYAPLTGDRLEAFKQTLADPRAVK